MTNRRRASGLLVLVVLALVACGSEEQQSDPGGPPAAVPAIDYARTGGIGGIEQRLRIGGSGAATLDGFAFTLRDDERAELATAAKGVDFAANAGHGRGDAHPDAFVYSLRVAGRPVLDGDYVIPQPVTALVAALDRLVAAHSPARRALEREARGLLVLMVRDGGVAGEHVELRLARDGRARVTFGYPGADRQTVRLTPTDEQLAAIRRELDAGDPASLRSPRDPSIMVADGFSYLVMTGGATIAASDPLDNPRLERLLQALEVLVGNARPGTT
jgi:hypothetical protein